MIILGTNSIKDTGYDVANSLRFNDGSSDYLNRTPSGASSTKTKFTYNCWVKRSKLGTEQNLIEAGTSSNERTYLSLGVFGTDELSFVHRTGGSNAIVVTGTNLLRDVSAWYMITLKYDSTDGTANNRVRLFINNVEVAYTTQTMPSSNATTYINNNTAHFISKASHAGERYLDGYLSEVVMVDATALNPDSFSEVDEDSGILKPISVSGLTFGTNGFYLDFEDSGALGADVSGNSNNFTVNNLTAIDQTTDTCTTNFALANPLNVNASNVGTFAFGNTTVKVANSSGFSFGSSSTIGVSSGKWYCEAKIITVDATMVGVSANVAEDARDNYPPGVQGGAQSVGILVSSGNKYIDDSGTTHGAALSADDILMIALDLDNNNVYFGKDGNWFDGSGNADESSPNSAIAITAVGSTAEGAYFFSFGDGGGSSKGKVSWNFGNASHAISSGNTDGDGYGNFEYAVPSGYFSLNTKNLAEYG